MCTFCHKNTEILCIVDEVFFIEIRNYQIFMSQIVSKGVYNTKCIANIRGKIRLKVKIWSVEQIIVVARDLLIVEILDCIS